MIQSQGDPWWLVILKIHHRSANPTVLHKSWRGYDATFFTTETPKQNETQMHVKVNWLMFSNALWTFRSLFNQMQKIEGHSRRMKQVKSSTEGVQELSGALQYTDHTRRGHLWHTLVHTKAQQCLRFCFLPNNSGLRPIKRKFSSHLLCCYCAIEGFPHRIFPFQTIWLFLLVFLSFTNNVTPPGSSLGSFRVSNLWLVTLFTQHISLGTDRLSFFKCVFCISKCSHVRQNS